MKPETIKIDDVEYIRKDGIVYPAESLNGMPYKMIRTRSAGVFAGYVYKADGQTLTLKRARRIWYWTVAASLSQLAQEGTTKPNECKFPCEMDEVTLHEVIEEILITAQAQKSIAGVKIWKA